MFSKRPLTVKKLAEASVIDVDSGKPFDSAERLFEPASIISILSGLVSVTNGFAEYSEVRLAHFSVEEYLVSERLSTGRASKFHLSFSPSTHRILAACLYYLQSADVHSESGTHFGTESPLLLYASKFWPAHAQDSQGSLPEPVKELMLEFFGCSNGFSLWQRVSFDTSEAYYDDVGCYSPWTGGLAWSSQHRAEQRLESHISPLYYACRFRLLDIVETLLDKDARRSDEEESGTPLTAPTQHRVARPGLYANELRAACYFGHEDVFFRLIRAGADVTAFGGTFKTALGATMQAASPNLRILGALLEEGGSLSVDDFITGWIMRWAVNNGHLNFVELLLAKATGHEFDLAYNWTRPPPPQKRYRLSEPNFSRNALRRDDVVDSRSYQHFGTSPYEAAFAGHYQILQLLIGIWDNVDEADSEGRTALYWAAFHGHEDVVKLLLENGAKPNVTVRVYSWRPIDWALSNGNKRIEQLLL